MTDAALPNLFILGAMKCGTTSLYRYLAQHPDVYFPIDKEPQFFCNDELFSRGIGFYQRRYFKNAARYTVRADATPHYLYYEKAARRIKEFIPEQHLRFVVILRDPVARAYSHYWNMVQEGIEVLSFEAALDQEAIRLENPEHAALGTLPYHYFAAGRYAAQIRAYYGIFSPDKFLLLLQDDLQDDPQRVMGSLFEFLGLEPMSVETTAIYNPAGASRSIALQRWIRRSGYVKNTLGRMLPYGIKYRLVNALLNFNKKELRYAAIDPPTATALRARFCDDICDLEALTGRDLSSWK